MYNTALRIVTETDTAADVLQEAFIDAFRRLNSFREESTFGLWIKQIVINKSLSALRRKKIELVPLAEADQFTEEDAQEDEDIDFQVQQVREAIQKLPDGYRIVLSLHLLEGFDHEEIAHILKINEATSRSQYLRGKKKLLTIIERDSG